jgi:myo-inositol-1-phosphate synthase
MNIYVGNLSREVTEDDLLEAFEEFGQCGILTAPSAYFCKHPPKQFTDDEAYRMTEAFIQEK